MTRDAEYIDPRKAEYDTTTPRRLLRNGAPAASSALGLARKHVPARADRVLAAKASFSSSLLGRHRAGLGRIECRTRHRQKVVDDRSLPRLPGQAHFAQQPAQQRAGTYP